MRKDAGVKTSEENHVALGFKCPNLACCERGKTQQANCSENLSRRVEWSFEIRRESFPKLQGGGRCCAESFNCPEKYERVLDYPH